MSRSTGAVGVALALRLLVSASWAAGPMHDAGELSLRTDGLEPLHTHSMHVGLPFGVPLERLHLEFGFETSEAAEPNAFLDALSVSLQPGNDARSALLFTADARGVLWAPPHPGGFELAAAALVRTSIEWTNPPPGTTWVAYELSLTVPEGAYECGTRVVLDLFDNGDARFSGGYVRDVRLEPGRSYFLLESSASPVGPFAAEMGVRHRQADELFELRAGGVARFFRLHADSEVTLRMLTPDAESWRFAYEFPEPNPRLVASRHVKGPFTMVTNAVVDKDQRRIRIPAGSENRFYRVEAAVRTTVTAITRTSAGLEVSFEYRPRVFGLQSSAQPCGPYADDPSARFDTAAQRVTVPRRTWVRFFRIARSRDMETPMLRSVQTSADDWVIRYEGVPQP